MNKLSEREIRDLLTPKDTPAPPAGLAERIKSEIPESLETVPIGDAARFRRSSPMRRYLLAAAVAMAFGGGFFAYRLQQEMPLGGAARVESAAEDDAAPAETGAHAALASVDEIPTPAPEAEIAPSSDTSDKAEVLRAQLEQKRQQLAAPLERLLAEEIAEPEQAQPEQPPSLQALAEPPASRSSETAIVIPPPPPAPVASPAPRDDRARRTIAQAQEQAITRREAARVYELDAEAETSATAASGTEGLRALGYLAEVEPRSAFAPGADIPSYEVVRRFLRDGQMPAPEAVRVEELVNHFDYGDAPPRRGDFAIHAEGAPSPFGEGEPYHLLRFHLRARDPEAGFRETIAVEAQVQVVLNPEVVSRYRLAGHDDREMTEERFRELVAGHAVTTLYEIELRRPLQPGDEVATLHLRYGSVIDGEMVETARRVTGKDFAGTWDDASAALRLTSLVAEFGEILRQSYWARSGDLDEVFRRAQRVAVEFPGDAEVAEFASLVGRAAGYRE